MTIIDFDLVYRKYYDDVYLYLMTLSNNDSELSKDLVQETFLELHNKIPQLETCGFSRSWLTTVARNKYFNECKKTKNLKELISIDDVNADIDLRLHIETEFDPGDLNDSELLKSLNSREKQLIVYFYQEKISIAEISKIYGISEPSCYKRIERLREKIKKFSL